jgi:hypothetical protein
LKIRKSIYNDLKNFLKITPDITTEEGRNLFMETNKISTTSWNKKKIT